jgi:hypothetical protein
LACVARDVEIAADIAKRAEREGDVGFRRGTDRHLAAADRASAIVRVAVAPRFEVTTQVAR